MLFYLLIDEAVFIFVVIFCDNSHTKNSLSLSKLDAEGHTSLRIIMEGRLLRQLHHIVTVPIHTKYVECSCRL